MISFRRIRPLASASFLAAALLSAPLSRAAEPLLLQWGTIDTSSHAAQAESAALKAKVAKKAALARARKSAVPEERAAYIVQFPGPVTEEWRTWLEASTQVRGYLPEFAYLVWATATEMDTIAANSDVFWTGEWKKDYKTVLAGSASPAKTTASASANEARWMQVGSLLTGDDGAADLGARLEALPAEVRSAFPRLDGSSAVAHLTDAQIDEVASWPDVEWIEPKLRPRLFNDQAARTNMMNVSNVWKSLSSGGLGLTGSGQIVAVADTGCDKGSTSDIHADFAGRVVAGYGWTNGAYKSSASWADLDAHGTHVAGSVLGSGAKSSGQFKGMAYEAQLVMQGCWEDLGGLPDDVQDLFKQAYNAGARIHSDSWGFGTNYAGRYVYDAVDADGYMWTNQNFLALFAAGNDGIDKNSDGIIDAGSVTPPSTAKNCICVGAAENWRANGGYSRSKWGSAWPSDYPADPIKTDYISETDTPQGLAAFSSRGPTQDGRFKPDIVAPGTDIISVRSRAASDTGWGLYSANTNYIYEGGTSMATPLTSGATALVRQWLVDRKGISEPPAALMKALLINGARDMTPGQYDTAHQEITARPDRSQGFGHVNLYNSLEPGDGNFLVFATNKLTTSANFTTNIAVGQPNAGKYLLTLVWQDYPGSSGGSKNLVNDLDLTVTSPSGTVYYPNNLSGLDHTNNVEFIEFTASETGSYAVKVNGYSVSKTAPNGGQPFALVMRGPETELEEAAPAFSAATSSTNGGQYEDIEFDFRALLTDGYPTPVYTLTTSVSTNEYDFESDTGFLYFQPANAGTFTFECVASNSLGTATNTLTVTVTLAPPAVPANLTLSNVGTTSFDASWSAADNATSYSLDIATVSGSATPVALISEDFSTSMGWTASGSSYTSGSHEDANGTWTYDNAIFHPSDSASSPGSAGNIQLQKNAWLYFPTVDNPSSISINAKGSSDGTMILQQQISGSWTTIATESISATVANYAVSVSDAGAATAFRVYSSDRALYLYDVTVSGVSASYSSLSGYPKSVSGISTSVTGLSPSTDYAARVRGVNADGTSDWSAWATATTTAGDSAPSWTAFPAQTYRYGSNGGYFDFDVSSYVSGSPAPALGMADTDLNAVFLEESGAFTFIPDALGTFSFTFTASNTLGVATNVLTVTVDAIAPELAAIGDRGGTVGTDVEFPLSATGDPAPVFDVTSDDAEAVVIDQAGTSYFLFSPDATGTFHFTVTATNIAGTDSESFTVTVSDTPVTVPTLTITNITATSALASWTACDNVTTYTLQLASDDQFTSGGSGAAVLEETFDTTNAPSGWTISDGGTYNGSPYVSSTYARKFTKVNQYAITPDFGSGTALQFWAYGNGGSGSIFTISGLVNSVWTFIDTVSIAQNASNYDVTLPSGTSQIGFYFTTRNNNCGLDDVVVTGASGSGSLIRTETVSDTEFTFTGLSPETTYYARVKGDDAWSNVEEFTTESAGDTAPVWSASFPSTATANVGGCYQLDNVSSYVSGSPAPVITLTAPAGVTATYENDTFRFSPSASGDYTFTFTASNSVGTADATLVVTASPAPVTVPELTVTDVTDTTALATWTACDGVSSYTLQLASDDQFTTGGSGGGETPTLLSESFEGNAIPADWTTSGSDIGLASGKSGDGTYCVAFKGSGAYLITEAVENPTDISFMYKRSNKTSPWGLDISVGPSVDGPWTGIGSIDSAETTWNTYETNFTASGTVYLKFTDTRESGAQERYVDLITVTGSSGSSGDGSLILSTNVSATTCTFIGLSPETTYYARVKGNADWSGTETFTTLASAPADPFEQWLVDHDASGHAAGETAPNGMTYYENYIADIDPANTVALTLVPTASGSQFTIAPNASSNRYYQFIYSTNLAEADAFATNNLGMGATNVSSISFPADWYGSIRVLLDAPAAP